MIVVLHVLVALGGLVQSTYAFFAPSKGKVNASFALLALTIASGSYLVVSTHAPMLQACMTGLLYTGVVSFGIVGARYKLAKQTAKNHEIDI